MTAAISLEAGGGLAHDLGSAAITAGVALALLKFFEELAKRGVFEQVSGLRVSPPFWAYLRR
jgi:farnesol kinase